MEMKEILVFNIAPLNKSICLRELSEKEFRKFTNYDSNLRSIKTTLNPTKELEQRFQRLIERYSSPARSFGLYDDKTYIGYISFAEYGCSNPEIQIEIQENYQNCGIGYKALSFLISEIFRQRADIEYFTYNVCTDNIASLKLIEKLGGKFIKQAFCIAKYRVFRNALNSELKTK